MKAPRLSALLLAGLPLVYAGCGGDNLTLPSEGEPVSIEIVDGNNQNGRVGSELDKALIVRVTDSQDRPVPGVAVQFVLDDGEGDASPEQSVTDGDGRASSRITLGTQVGSVTGIARVPVPEGMVPVETSFTATALSADANGIAAVSGDGQSGPVGSTLPAPLVIAVTDAFGNPIKDVTVQWSVTGGGSVSESSTQTNDNGQASVTRTLGSTAGPQTTLATAEGLAGSPVTFTHTATAGTATGVVKVSGDGQSALAGTELAAPLVVQVLDAQSNPISGRPVTWVASGDGRVDPQNTTTDAQGQASTRWTLDPDAGPNTATAVVSGVGTATFTATGTAGTPSAANSTVAASPTTITAGVTTSTVTVTVRDANGNAVSGASVAISSTGTGNEISPASVSTGGNGVATFTFGSNVAESKIISATAGGVAIIDQATITVQKASSSVEITSDDPEPSSVNESIRVEFTVEGPGGTPTGTVTVTVSDGNETCTGTLSSGSGFCDVVLTVPPVTDSRRVLTATYSGDSRYRPDTDTDNHRMNPVAPVNHGPEASFQSSCTGLSCTFTDRSTDPDGDQLSYSWDFDDGSSSTDRNPAHTYAEEGTYDVKLTVRDGPGATDEFIQQVTVTAPPSNNPPTAAFTHAECIAGTECQFTDASTDPDGNETITGWSWDFGDPLSLNNSANVQNPTHSFTVGGGTTYPVTLTITDGEATSTITQDVTVQ